MTDRSELPLPDYDHLPQGSIEHRIRSLTAQQVELLREYEQRHAGRPAVLELLCSRLDQLAAGSQPTGGDQTGARPEKHDGTPAGSQVSPDAAAEPAKVLRHAQSGQSPNRNPRRS